MIDHGTLIELCAYDPEAGLLTWRRSKGAAKAGRPVGGVHRSRGYGGAMINGQKYQTHRLVWFYVHGAWPSGEIDHINGDRDDNRVSNLRDVPPAINRQNLRRPYRNKKSSKLLGAHFNKRYQKWVAHICINYQQIYLGSFESEQAAHDAYLKAKRTLHVGCVI